MTPSCEQIVMSKTQIITLSGAEIGILQAEHGDTMAVVGRGPYVARSSTANMMTLWNGSIFCVSGLCAWNSPVIGKFPSERPARQSFDAFCDLHIEKQLSKQSQGWRFETPSRSLRRHCNEVINNAVFCFPVLRNNVKWKCFMFLQTRLTE